MGNTAQTANRMASGGLRFLFAPQIGSGLRPTKMVLLSFVQIIAQFLASAKLIPADHRSLRPLSANDARLGEVLALAFANVRRPGSRIDQWAVFVAVNCLAALVAVMIGHMAFSLLIGTAHAFTITLTFNQAGCGFAVGAGLFQTGCANDMAQQWIDMLVLGNTTNWFAAQIASRGVITGLAAMFQTYSTAMLIIAGFLVLYHLLVIIAGTAHEGKFGGRMMNQVWAPIRLVAAIGMLVPIGINGLNSGQVLVTQVAKWGSALASNVWINFANTYAANTGAYVLFPPMPQVSGFVKDVLKVLVCEAGVNDLGAEGGPPQYEVERIGWWTSDDMLRMSFNYKNNLSTDDYEPEACGYIELKDPAYTTGGESFSYLGPASAINANDTLRRDMLTAHRNAIDNMIATGSPLMELAQAIWDSANTANTGVILQESDVRKFNDAVNNYRNTLRAGILASISASTALTSMSMANQAMSRGWVSASVWFNDIAKTNGWVLNQAQYVPAADFDFEVPISEDFIDRMLIAEDLTDDSIAALPSMAANGSTFVIAEPDYMMAYSNVGRGDDLMSYFLGIFSGNMLKLLGYTNGNTSDEISNTCGAITCQFKLNTANPLAELSALGYRMIALTFATTRTLAQCQADEANKVNGMTNEDYYKTSTQGTLNRASMACSGGNGGVNPMYFLVQSVVGTMLIAGITLAFILPMIPFIRFMFGIMAWVLALLETVVAIPVVALAHIKMEGDGLAGPMARTAYLLMLQLFLRPTLMIFGLILALLVFNLMIVALNQFYSEALRSVEAGGDLASLSAVVYSALYGMLAYSFANASFKTIDLIPNQCLQWIGGSGNNAMAGETDAVTGRFGSGVSGIASSANQVSSNTAGRISYTGAGRV